MAVLDLLLARLTSAPLVLAAAHPIDRYAEVLLPDLRHASRRRAEQAIRRSEALIERAIDYELGVGLQSGVAVLLANAKSRRSRSGESVVSAAMRLDPPLEDRGDLALVVK